MNMKSLLPLMVCATCLAGFGARAEGDLSAVPESALEARLNPKSPQRLNWFIEPHRPNYVLPVSYIKDPSQNLQNEAEAAGAEGGKMQEIEVKFQISLKLAAAHDLIQGNGDLYFAYTQVSVWQAYNADNSSPFRDTNYEPEMFLSFDTDYNVLGLHGRLASLGIVHQSNGRSDVLSRSWNRIYANLVLERGNFVTSVKPWYRIPEDEEEDNNPDIADYYGYGELRMAYKWKEHVFATLMRYNFDFSDSKGAVELDWSFPLAGPVKGFVQYFDGYGETLLDYNERDTRIGIGFLLADWI